MKNIINFMIWLILKTLWFILPAYMANAAPPVFARVRRLEKYHKPVDNGKKLKGKEIFGEGKTWLGLISGVLAGTVFGFLQSLTNVQPMMTLELAFTLSLGALIGDMIGSFIKRRLGFSRGKAVPLLDQLDFLLGAFILSSLVVEINFSYLIVLLIITPMIHLGTNIIGYKLKIKKVPW
jgi:CDP-2,3-bis-(O-geranylgeranyl)-sn-glycerol synthase